VDLGEPPRSDQLCKRLARRLVPWWHFVGRKHRLEIVQQLLRNGRVSDMVIVARGHSHDNIVALQMKSGGPTLVCNFEHDFETKPGTTMRVLWSPSSPPVLACDEQGRIHVGQMR
jgi:hypothetical protein